MADKEEKQGISKYLDEIGLGILAGLIKGLIYDEQGRNRFSLLAELIGQNTTAINKRALKATESDATDANSYVKKADSATNADTVDNKHASDFATSAQGTKADSAVQTIQINGTAQTKTNGVVNLPAYPTVPTKTSDLTNDSGFITSSSIPSVNNGTLTIKAGGTSKGTFTANQSGNTEVNITASDLGLSSALKYVGSVSSLPTPTTSDAYNNGDVVSVGDKEYLRTGKTSSSAGYWKELGDESSHALKTITITGTGALSGGGTLEQNRTITHTISGVIAGTYRCVTVNAYGHVTAGTNPTTIEGYGITDAKIANGVITLGNNTITPITSHQDISGLVKTSDLTASTAIAGSHVTLADRVDMSCIRLTSADDLNLLYRGTRTFINPSSSESGYRYNPSGNKYAASGSYILYFNIGSGIIGVHQDFGWNTVGCGFLDSSNNVIKVYPQNVGDYSVPSGATKFFITTNVNTGIGIYTYATSPLLTSTSQNRVERYDWTAGATPSNCPISNYSAMMTMTLRYVNNSVTHIIQRINGAYSDTDKEYSRIGYSDGSKLTWYPWVELSQESRALTEDEITNIWNNIFN